MKVRRIALSQRATVDKLPRDIRRVFRQVANSFVNEPQTITYMLRSLEALRDSRRERGKKPFNSSFMWKGHAFKKARICVNASGLKMRILSRM